MFIFKIWHGICTFFTMPAPLWLIFVISIVVFAGADYIPVGKKHPLFKGVACGAILVFLLSIFLLFLPKNNGDGELENSGNDTVTETQAEDVPSTEAVPAESTVPKTPYSLEVEIMGLYHVEIHKGDLKETVEDENKDSFWKNYNATLKNLDEGGCCEDVTMISDQFSGFEEELKSQIQSTLGQNIQFKEQEK